mgnify:CR=1 FL=1
MCLRSGSLDLSTVVWDLEMLARLGLSATGVIAFAASGALEAKRREMDAVGIITLACCTAVGGGMIRDVLIGAIPVAALVDLWMLALSVLAALVVMVLVRTWERLRIPLLLCDAVGLGMFTVDGALKGLAFGLHPAAAVLAGVVTGVGGGILRDVLASEVPLVFRRRSPFYVVAALLGSGLIVWLASMGVAGGIGMFGTATLIFLIRMAGLRYGWHIPNGRNRSRGVSDSRGPQENVS